MQRPELNIKISSEEFNNFYWLKEELVSFCRSNGLSTAGGKLEISKRISNFLETGEKSINTKTSKSFSKHKAIIPKSIDEISLQTIIGENFKCTQIHREFFKIHAGKTFHFSTKLQKFFKENPEKSYRDALDYWKEIKDDKTKDEIAPQFEYNRFFRAYFEDPKNKSKSRNDAILAWNTRKSLPGSNEYSSEEGF